MLGDFTQYVSGFGIFFCRPPAQKEPEFSRHCLDGAHIVRTLASFLGFGFISPTEVAFLAWLHVKRV